MMSKAELARKAGLSTLTIDRVEAGRPCRLETKRKILLALGLKVSDKERLFGMAVRVAASALERAEQNPPTALAQPPDAYPETPPREAGLPFAPRRGDRGDS